MIRLIPFCTVILFFCLSFSCDKERPETFKDKLAWEDFRDFLTKDTDYQAIVAKFGTPDRDAGSGIHIYVWVLKDSTEIWIGYVDKIIYARHLDKEHNVVYILL